MAVYLDWAELGIDDGPSAAGREIGDLLLPTDAGLHQRHDRTGGAGFSLLP